MKKLTKRQRKIINGPNAAVRRSFADGLLDMVGGTQYKGRNPTYSDPEAGYPIKKLQRGVPFVRVEPKHRYIA